MWADYIGGTVPAGEAISTPGAKRNPSIGGWGGKIRTPERKARYSVALWIFAAQKRVIAFGAYEKAFSGNGCTKAAWPPGYGSHNGEKRVMQIKKRLAGVAAVVAVSIGCGSAQQKPSGLTDTLTGQF